MINAGLINLKSCDKTCVPRPPPFFLTSSENNCPKTPDAPPLFSPPSIYFFLFACLDDGRGMSKSARVVNILLSAAINRRQAAGAVRCVRVGESPPPQPSRPISRHPTDSQSHRSHTELCMLQHRSAVSREGNLRGECVAPAGGGKIDDKF